jgi:hypothetical protein
MRLLQIESELPRILSFVLLAQSSSGTTACVVLLNKAVDKLEERFANVRAKRHPQKSAEATRKEKRVLFKPGSPFRT